MWIRLSPDAAILRSKAVIAITLLKISFMFFLFIKIVAIFKIHYAEQT